MGAVAIAWKSRQARRCGCAWRPVRWTRTAMRRIGTWRSWTTPAATRSMPWKARCWIRAVRTARVTSTQTAAGTGRPTRVRARPRRSPCWTPPRKRFWRRWAWTRTWCCRPCSSAGAPRTSPFRATRPWGRSRPRPTSRGATATATSSTRPCSSWATRTTTRTSSTKRSSSTSGATISRIRCRAPTPSVGSTVSTTAWIRASRWARVSATRSRA